jgi:hypothetical protein
VNRLRKRDVEALLETYDTDPIGALTGALRLVLGDTSGSFVSLLASAPIDAERRALLLAHDVDALDALLAELNETRTLGG